MKGVNHIVTTSPALRRLLLDCQTWCTADCGKQRAFTLTEDSISRWLRLERIDRSREVSEEIGKIKAGLQQVKGQVFLATPGLESGWGADDFGVFWCQLEAAFSLAVEAHTKARA